MQNNNAAQPGVVGVLDQESDGGVRTGNINNHPPTHTFFQVNTHIYRFLTDIFRHFSVFLTIHDFKKNRYKL